MNRTPVSRLTACWVKCLPHAGGIHHVARRCGEKRPSRLRRRWRCPCMKRKAAWRRFSLPRPSVPDEQSAHCAIGRLSCRAFWFTTTVAALDGGNAHRSCDTTDGEGAFDEQHPNFVGTYSAGASSKEVRQAIEDADRVICVGTRLSIPLRPDLPNNYRRNARWRFSLTRRASAKPGSTSRWRRRCLRCANCARMRFAPPPTRSAGQPVRIDKEN